MKKTISKILVLLLLAALTVGLFAGCYEGGDGYEMLPSEAPVEDFPPKDKEYNITILCARHTGYDNDSSELWFFQYMEYWFAQQGYTVNIDVQSSADINQTKSLALNTDNLPDLMWSVQLKNDEILKYAVDEGMILEWSKYINTTLMPNLTKRMEEQPESKTMSIAPNGGIYGIPYYAPSQIASGCYGTSERLYFRQSWLDAAGVENPETLDELLNVLRAFKTKITDPSPDKQDVPLVSSSSFLEKYLWTCLGFYGTEPGRYGTNLMIKNEEVVLPAYTESYRDFVTIMKTMYDEGLIAKDFFSYNDASAGALINAGQCGALAWWTLEYVGDQFADIVCANPIPMGDVESVEDIHVSRLKSVYPNYLWASSKYEEPRILAMMIDFVYSDEGAWLYRYGPSKEEGDPLGLVDGWYFDEKGEPVNDYILKEGTDRTTMSDYGRWYLFPNDYAGLRPAVVTSGPGGNRAFTDSVTGETYYVIDNVTLSDDNNDGHWRLITIEKWSDRATSIRLPDIYMSYELADDYKDLKNAVNQWINSETAKFITGQRPLSEIELFWQELEGLGVKEYLQMSRDGYADYMDLTYGKTE